MRWLWWFALVACSSSHPARPDAPFAQDDAPADAFDACTDSSVRLTVTKDGVPQAGVHVYFGDDDELYPGVVQMTDGSGVACGYVEVGLYQAPIVTAVNPFGPLGATKDELFSFEMVEPGDHLVLAQTEPAPTTVTVTFPDDAGASSYHLYTNCGSAPVTSGASVDLAGCGPTIDVLLESLTDTGASKGWLYQADVPLASALALTGSFQPAVTEQLAFDTDASGGDPVVTPELGIHARLATSKGIVYDGPSIAFPISSMNVHPTFDLVRPSIPGATSMTDIAFGYATHDDQHYVDWYAPGTSHHFDLTTGSVPSFESPVTFSGGTLQYTFSGGQVPADAVRTTVDFTTVDRSWRWHVVSSYWARNGVFRFPRLPADGPDHNVGAATSSQVVEAMLFTVPGATMGFALTRSVWIRRPQSSAHRAACTTKPHAETFALELHRAWHGTSAREIRSRHARRVRGHAPAPVLRCIGRGGAGTVYEAADVERNSPRPIGMTWSESAQGGPDA